LRIDRVDAGWFRYAYSVVQNRDLYTVSMELETPSARALRRRLDRRYWVEQKHFELLEALRNDRILLARIAARHAGRPLHETDPLRLRGIGFFADRSAHAPALRPLRAHIAANYGADYLGSEIAALDAALRDLPLATAQLASPVLEPDRHPALDSLLSERFGDLALRRAALELIARAAPLRAGGLRRVDGERGRVRASEREALEQFSRRLAARIVELVRSAPAQSGYPMLLALARLSVLHATLESDRWTVLDAYPHDASTLGGGPGRHSRVFLSELEDYAEGRFEAVRGVWGNHAQVGERAYSDIEEAANRLIEVHRGIARRTPIRVARNRLIPQGLAGAEFVPLPEGAGADLRELGAAAGLAEDQFLDALEERYACQLVQRNCVTELLRETHDEAHGLDPDASFNFVPVVAFRSLREQRAALPKRIPSFRTIQLARMKQKEHPIPVFLRESNTFTSSVYRRNPKDSWFVFFTDDAVWPRPLFGGVNLAAGLLESAWGLVSLPVVGSERLVAGVQGVVFSLPELVFVNLRKGTLEYGPRVVPEVWASAESCR